MTDIEKIREALIKRARNLVAITETELAAAATPDHKLAILGNNGDVALTLLPHLCDELDRLAARVGEAEKVVQQARSAWDAATFGNLHRLSHTIQSLGEAIQALDALPPPPETDDD